MNFGSKYNMRYSKTFASCLLLLTLNAFAQKTAPRTDSVSFSMSEFMNIYNNVDTALTNQVNRMIQTDIASASVQGRSNAVPGAADFRKAFIALMPAIKSEFSDIGSQQTSGDIEEGVTMIPSEEEPLPGTANNNYESLVDGITLTYAVTLRAGIDSNLTAAQAARLAGEWKTMLLAAFPESASLFTDKTSGDGNRFISVAYLINTSQPAYSGGFTLTLQDVAEKGKYYLDLVIAEKKEK